MGLINTFKEVLSVPEMLGLRTGDSASTAPSTSVPNTPENTDNLSVNREVLFSWTAPNKLPHSGIDSKVRRSMIIVGIVIGLLLIIMQEFLLILAIGSFFFVRYVIAATPGVEVKHEITTLGLIFAGEFYSWDMLVHYFFTHKHSMDIMAVDLKKPGRLMFIVNAEQKSKIQELMFSRLLYLEEPPRDFLDDAYKSTLRKFTTSS